nr:hypothetical protein Iba_chr13aCG11690 [Ipomoea batatas]
MVGKDNDEEETLHQFLTLKMQFVSPNLLAQVVVALEVVTPTFLLITDLSVGEHFAATASFCASVELTSELQLEDCSESSETVKSLSDQLLVSLVEALESATLWIVFFLKLRFRSFRENLLDRIAFFGLLCFADLPAAENWRLLTALSTVLEAFCSADTTPAVGAGFPAMSTPVASPPPPHITFPGGLTPRSASSRSLTVVQHSRRRGYDLNPLDEQELNSSSR